MERIDSIELKGVVPDVFAGRSLNSGIWATDVAFTRPGKWLVRASSGTGKSSLCSFIYGSRTDYSGRLLIGGVDARTLSPDRWCELRRRHLALLPQDMALFPELSVLDNIEVKNRLTRYKSSGEILGMLERLGVAEKAHELAGRLSLGQQQRVAVVRTLCQPFDFLLLDEPVSHLDSANNTAVSTLITEEVSRQDAGLIVTSVGNDLDIADASSIIM